VRERVGGFFRNTVREPGRTCSVCAGVVDGFDRCYRCNLAHREWGSALADVVMPLAYAYRRSDQNRARAGRHQSEQHMWSYKEAQPGPGCVADLTAMLLVALQWHRPCVEVQVGLPWQCWAVVPSSRHLRSGPHPLVRLGDCAGLGGEAADLLIGRVNLTLASELSNDREIHADRFAVADPEAVEGRHVLLLEDTWVTGASAQSAVLTLKEAGAAAATILPLARWIREDGKANEQDFFSKLTTPYDASMCPITGARCAGPFSPYQE